MSAILYAAARAAETLTGREPKPAPPALKPTVPPPVLTMADRANIQAAIDQAHRLYPKPVATILAAELTAWQAFGYRTSLDGAVQQLIRHLLDT